MTEKRRFFSGPTLEQAVARAARHYEVDPVDLSYREREKKHGFLHRRRGVVVEVNPAEPTLARGAGEGAESAEPATDREPGASAALGQAGSSGEAALPVREEPGEAIGGGLADDLFSEEWWQGDEGESDRGRGDGRPSPDPSDAAPRELAAAAEPARGQFDRAEGPRAEADRVAKAGRAVAPAGPVASGPLADAATGAASRLLRLAAVSLECEIREGEERLEFELTGNDQQIVLEQGGEVLLAIEHLLPRVIRGLAGEGVACRVDADGFHARREARLRELAERRAEDVSRSRRRRTLPPMSPEERRFVHMALADRGDVRTESRGEGYFKRVTIFPQQGRRR